MRWLALLAFLASSQAAAQPSPRCPRYAADWAAAQRHFDLTAISLGFVAAHQTFLDSGCRSRAPICPRGPAETHLADAMTIAAMNAGAASSFLPFRCPD